MKTANDHWELYSGKAALYAKVRPGYPDDAIRLIVDTIIDSDSKVVVDVGSGTGILSRILARKLPKGSLVVGIEPNDEMRTHAEAICSGIPEVRFLYGLAEEMPVPTGSVALVCAATAAHWFNRDLFYKESKRVLKTGGAIVIIHNKRRYWDSDFMESIEKIQEKFIDGYRRDLYRNYLGQYTHLDIEREIKEEGAFKLELSKKIAHSQELSTSQFRELCLSMAEFETAAIRAGREQILGEIDRISLAFADRHGNVHMEYLTEVIIGRMA